MVWIFAIVLAASGCAGPAGPTGASARAPAAGVASVPEAMLRAKIEGAEVELPNEHGLEVRQWLIEDNVAAVEAAYAAFGEPALREARASRLAENGLRFFRVPVESLEDLRRALGGTSFDLKMWQGQVLDWRELHDRSLGGSVRAVAVDGLVKRFSGGAFGLLLRSWTMPMEDGPRVLLQVAPVFERADPTGLRALVRGSTEDFAGEVFRPLAMEVMLEAGWAYVLTAEAPRVVWDGTTTAAEIGSPVSGGPAGGAGARRGTGPYDAFGPAAATPMTVGEMMLRSEVAGAHRGVIVFVPRLPPGLFPAGAADEPSATAAGADTPPEPTRANEPARPAEAHDDAQNDAVDDAQDDAQGDAGGSGR